MPKLSPPARPEHDPPPSCPQPAPPGTSASATSKAAFSPGYGTWNPGDRCTEPWWAILPAKPRYRTTRSAERRPKTKGLVMSEENVVREEDAVSQEDTVT